MKKFSVFIFLITCLACLQKASGQQFSDDGTMMLQEVATDKVYGYSSKVKNSIKVGSIKNETAFLKALQGPSGEPIRARRLSSCCVFKSKRAAFGKGYLDLWEITYEGLQQPILIYLNGYEFDNPKCPAGLSIKPEAKADKESVN